MTRARVSVMARDITGRRQNEQLERDRRQVVEMVARNQPLEAVLIQLGNLVEHQTGRAVRGVVAAKRPNLLGEGLEPAVAVVDVLDEHVLEIMTGAARWFRRPGRRSSVGHYPLQLLGKVQADGRSARAAGCWARRSWRRRGPGQDRRSERSWFFSANSEVLSRRNSG